MLFFAIRKIHRSRLFLLIIALVIANLSFSQQDTKEKVAVEIKLAQDAIHPGKEGFAMLIATIQDGWHINSATPADENLIETTVHLKPPKGVSFLAIHYPAGKEVQFGFADAPLAVYEGSVHIPIHFQIAQDVIPGEYTVPVSFGYQACNDKVCLAPNTLSSDLHLKVIPEQHPVSLINKDLFKNIVRTRKE